MNKIYILILALTMSGFGTPVFAYNIAKGLIPELNGTYGTDQGEWAYYQPAQAFTLTDGKFKREPALWNLNSVWWNGASHPQNEIIIRLGSQLKVTGFTIQADDNDTYVIEFRAADIDEWTTIFEAAPVNTWGLRKRTRHLNHFEVIETLRITAKGGDGLYSISEIQVFSDEPHPDAVDQDSKLELLRRPLAP